MHPRESKHVTLINTKTWLVDGYNLYMYHRIKQQDVHLKNSYILHGCYSITWPPIYLEPWPQFHI